MLGNLIGELQGRITGTRILDVSPLGEVRQEISYAGHGKLLGVDCHDTGTGIQRRRLDGVIEAESGNLVLAGRNGEIATLTSLGVGLPTGTGGHVRYLGANVLHTTAAAWLPLTRMLLVTELDLDAAGHYAVKVWEWK